MFHKFRRIIILLLVGTTLGVPQGSTQNTKPAVEGAGAAIDQQSAGLEETLTSAAAHTSAGQFAQGHQVLETALETAPTPEAQHALRRALAQLHTAWAHQ